MRSIGSPFIKLLKLHGGPLDGTTLNQTPAPYVSVGDENYKFTGENEEYYHYNYNKSKKKGVR